MKPTFLPSLLAADYGSLADELRRAEAAGADAIHLDIMDGHFVPNISFGSAVVSLAKRVTPDFERNVHLMLSQPDRYVEDFAKAGATTLQIHVEASCDIEATLKRIRALGMKAGLVLNPHTPPQAAFPYLELVDEVLYMSVFPGFGGQRFKPEMLPSLQALREKAPELSIMIDGGINRDTLPLAAKAGANAFVAGSALFSQQDMAAEIKLYHEIYDEALKA